MQSKLAMVAALVAFVPAVGGAATWPLAESKGLLTPLGEYVLVGGGVNDFVEDSVSDRFKLAGTWNVRLGIGSRSFIGLEAAYVGTRRNANLSNNDLTTNGIEGVLRLQYPYVRERWLIEPFAFAGVGWSHFSVDNVPAGLRNSDDVGVVPVGVGVSVGYRHILLDARFSYNATFNEDLVLSTTGKVGDLQNWAVIGSVGYEF